MEQINDIIINKFNIYIEIIGEYYKLHINNNLEFINYFFIRQYTI